MGYIDDVLGDIFPVGGRKFTYKENYTQTTEEKEAVQQWMDSEEGEEAFGLVYRAYHLQKSNIEQKPEIYVLSSPSANGFAIGFEPPMDTTIFSNLFFGFGIRMLDLGYYRMSLERKLQERNDALHITEKQYFKPAVQVSGGRRKDQLFGNVCVERETIEYEPVFLKVLVTVYAGRSYHVAKPFDQFVEELLGQV